MDKLTITIVEGDSGAVVALVRPLVTTAGAAIRAAVVAGNCAWRKNGQPWRPLCPMVNRQLPGEFRLSELFLAAIAASAEDKAALKVQLERLCGRLGVLPAAMTQPVTQLTPLQYHQLISALAILSPNRDIVLLPEASWLSAEEWAELLREFAPCPKTLWPVLPPSALGAQGCAVSICLTWTQPPPPSAKANLHTAARPVMPPAAPPAPRPLPAGLELTTMAELPPALAAMFGSEDGHAPVLWLKGSGEGDERPTYDLSAALQDASAAAQSAAARKAGWRIAISASADVVWGCLSRRRPSAAAGGVVAVAAGVMLRWWQMTTLAVHGNWQWRLSAGANLELTQLAPDFGGCYDVFELAGTDAGSGSGSGPGTGQAAVEATVVEFAKTYHNHTLPSSWQELGAGSKLLRLWRQGSGLGPRAEAMPPASGRAPAIINLTLGRPEPGGVPVAAALALLKSHGIAEPWDQLLASLAPKLRKSLPMEYYVDLLTLLPHD